MVILISSLLIPAGCVILIWGFLWLIYRIPLRMDLFFSKDQKCTCFFLGIGWGLLSIRIFRADTGWHIEGIICHTSLISRPMKRGETIQEPVTKGRKKLKAGDIFRFIPVIRRLLPELVRHITLDTISAYVVFGAGDPVTTGYVYGYYHALRPFISSKNCIITLTPDFNQIILEGTAEAVILITTPVNLLIKGARFILPEVIHMKRGI